MPAKISAGSNAAISAHAEIVLLQNLFDRLPWVLVFNAIIATCTVTAFFSSQPSSTLTSWYAMMLATIVLRLKLWRDFQSEDETSLCVVRWTRRFALGAAATGLVWGLAGFIFYDPNSIVAQIYLPFMLAGMTASSMVVQTGCMSAFTLFFIAAITPYALRLGLEGDAAHLSMAVALLAYMAALAILGRSINAYLKASVQLAAENEQLVEALKEKSDQLETTFHHIHQGVVVFSGDGRLVDWNSRHRELHGYPAALYRRGRDLRDFAEISQAMERPSDGRDGSLRLGSEEGASFRSEQDGADGRILEVECTSMPGGGLVSASTDITERKAAEQRLRESEERLALAVETADAAFIDGDLRRGVSYYNERAHTMLGYRPGELATSIRDIIKRIHPEHRARVVLGVEAMDKGGADTFKCEYRVRTKSGDYLWAALSLEVVGRDRHRQVTRVVGIRFDISERKKTEDRILYMATHDALTGLPNRSKLADILQSEHSRIQRRGGRLAVLFIDLDNFKHVNDSLGHTAGDLLLKEVARRLRSCLGTSDTVARLSGDEFAVLAVDRDRTRRFEHLADLILGAIEAPFEIDGDPILIGTSIGLACLDDHETGADQLMIHADLALYEAENGGRGQYRRFRPPMMQRVRARNDLNTALRHALKRGEFELCFQPIVSLESFRPTAIECLLRWHDPNHGLRSPRDFIMAIERSNLILAVSDWVMQSAGSTRRTGVVWATCCPPLPSNSRP